MEQVLDIALWDAFETTIKVGEFFAKPQRVGSRIWLERYQVKLVLSNDSARCINVRTGKEVNITRINSLGVRLGA